jgi:hypothetical protein
MKKTARFFLMLMLMGASGSVAFGDEFDATSEGRGPGAVDETHPIFSTDARWVGGVLVGIGGLFLAAMIVGPIVRAEAPEVVPVAMSHAEDPAADRLGHVDESIRS